MIRRDLRVLLALDASRVTGMVRSPAAGVIAGVVLPFAIAAALLWTIGVAGAPRLATRDDALLLSMLVAGPVSAIARAALFGWGDAALLRRLGIGARAIYAERAGRHLLQAMLIGGLAALPFLVGGGDAAAALRVGIAAGAASWGVGCAAAAAAGLAMARSPGGRRWGCLMAGIWDQDVAVAAPLAYAPLPGFIAGTAAGTLAFSGVPAMLGVFAVAVLAAYAGAGWYARALPRFGPYALEIAFVPPPAGEGTRLPIGRGAARLLPRPAAAVLARDAAAISRRSPWAARLAWVMAIGGFLALARWGTEPATRTWIIAGTLLTLLAQALAAIRHGAAESRGPRWFDRAVGIGWSVRLLGRWAWGWGASLYMTIPIAAAWGWWSGSAGAWSFILAGAATAAAGAAVSVLVAGLR